MSKYLTLGSLRLNPITPNPNIIFFSGLNVIFAGVGSKVFYVVVDHLTSVLFTVSSALLAKKMVKIPTTMMDISPPETVV